MTNRYAMHASCFFFLDAFDSHDENAKAISVCFWACWDAGFGEFPCSNQHKLLQSGL